MVWLHMAPLGCVCAPSAQPALCPSGRRGPGSEQGKGHAGPQLAPMPIGGPVLQATACPGSALCGGGGRNGERQQGLCACAALIPSSLSSFSPSRSSPVTTPDPSYSPMPPAFSPTLKCPSTSSWWQLSPSPSPMAAPAVPPTPRMLCVRPLPSRPHWCVCVAAPWAAAAGLTDPQASSWHQGS